MTGRSCILLIQREGKTGLYWCHLRFKARRVRNRPIQPISLFLGTNRRQLYEAWIAKSRSCCFLDWQSSTAPHTSTRKSNGSTGGLRPLSCCKSLCKVDHDRRNRLSHFLVENDVKQLNQVNTPLTSFAHQKMAFKLLVQLTVMVRRKQNVFQQPGIRAALVNFP